MKGRAGVGPNKKEGWAGDDHFHQKGIEWGISRMILAIEEWDRRKRPRNWLCKYGDLAYNANAELNEDGDVVGLFRMTLAEAKEMAPPPVRYGDMSTHSDPIVHGYHHH